MGDPEGLGGLQTGGELCVQITAGICVCNQIIWRSEQIMGLARCVV